MTLSEFRNIPIIELMFRLIPDSLYLRLLYRKNVGHWPNLSKPQSFTEKIQWLKLHNRKPEYTVMVDKHLVKDYVASIIGKEYIIPTIAVWNSVDEIDLSVLPNQFVLKWNHDSGSIVICKDKSKFSLEEAKKELAKGQRKNGFWYGREWPYKNVKPVIIAEQFMEEESRPSTDLADYKFYCFNGEPKYCQVIRDRSTEETIDFYDMDWNLMPFVGLNIKCKNGITPVDKPLHLEQMKDICRKLSDKSPFTRVDLYVINNKEYFGEITLFPASGFGQFSPKEWDERLGDLLQLQGAVGGDINVLYATI